MLITITRSEPSPNNNNNNEFDDQFQLVWVDETSPLWITQFVSEMTID